MKALNRILFFALPCAIACISGPARAEVVNRIAAVVNNEIITEHGLYRALASRQRGRDAARPDPNLRKELLDRMIDDALFNQILAKSKIEVSEDDLARAIANILHQNRMSIDQLKSEVASKGMTYEEYKKHVEKEIKRVKFVNQVIGPQVGITDQDLRDFYQRNQEKFRGSHRAHIAEIALPLEGISTQGEFDRLGNEALEMVAKARRGTSFESLAKQQSKGPNAAAGGDLGMVDLKDLPPQVADVVRTLKVGDVSNPIALGNAIVIVKLISLPEIASGDFDKLRDDIYQALYDQRIEETLTNYLQKERAKAFIEIR